MRWVILVALIALAGCANEVQEGTIVTFPDPAQGDTLVDGVWRGSRTYSGPKPAKARAVTPESEWPCGHISWNATGDTTPWNRDEIVNGNIHFKSWECESPIDKPWQIEIYR